MQLDLSDVTSVEQLMVALQKAMVDAAQRNDAETTQRLNTLLREFQDIIQAPMERYDVQQTHRWYAGLALQSRSTAALADLAGHAWSLADRMMEEYYKRYPKARRHVDSDAKT